MVEGDEPSWTRGLPVVHFHNCTAAPDVHTFRESALNSYTTLSDVTMPWSDWEDRQYVYMLVQGANRRNNIGNCV